LRLIGEVATAQQLEFQFQSHTRCSRPVLSVLARPCCSRAKASPTSPETRSMLPFSGQQTGLGVERNVVTAPPTRSADTRTGRPDRGKGGACISIGLSANGNGLEGGIGEAEQHVMDSRTNCE
jgi:hypothetical protein